ncbi:uncharacterized protein LOC143041196 [Oratosquilla oratoria]|uniref:uncharacterized protein LOC143041196 n=1 Tax=Oratosquilla oratoria TaxID=337810 RepID=UPI003F775D41
MPACSTYPPPPTSPSHLLPESPSLAGRSPSSLTWEIATPFSSLPSSPRCISTSPSSGRSSSISATPSSPGSSPSSAPQAWWPSPWAPAVNGRPSAPALPSATAAPPTGEGRPQAAQLLRASLQNATAAIRILLLGCFRCSDAKGASSCCRREQEEELEKAWFDCEQLQVEHPFCYANPVALAALHQEPECPSSSSSSSHALRMHHPLEVLRTGPPPSGGDLRSSRPRNLLYENEGRVLQACRAMSKSFSSEKDLPRAPRAPRPRLNGPSRPPRGGAPRVRRRHLRKEASPQVQQAPPSATSSGETQVFPNATQRASTRLGLLEEAKPQRVVVDAQGAKEKVTLGQTKALKEEKDVRDPPVDGRNRAAVKRPSRAENPEEEEKEEEEEGEEFGDGETSTSSMPSSDSPAPPAPVEADPRGSVLEEDLFKDDVFTDEVLKFETETSDLKDDLWSPGEIEGVFECFNMVSWYSYGGGEGRGGERGGGGGGGGDDIKNGFAKHSPDNNNNSRIKLCKLSGEKELSLPLPIKENVNDVRHQRKPSVTKEQLYETLFSDAQIHNNPTNLNSFPASSSENDNDLIVFKGRSFTRNLLVDLVKETNDDFALEYDISSRLGSPKRGDVVQSQVMATLSNVSGVCENGDQVIIPPEIEAVREATLRHRRREDVSRRYTPIEDMIRKTVLEELQKEGRSWHVLEEEEEEMKEETSAEIMDMLLDETTTVIDSIISKKRAIFS